MMSDEKRKAVRIAKRLEVKFPSTVESTAITNDLSENGLFITTSKGISPGNAIDIKLQLPRAEVLFISGKVVRSMRATQGRADGSVSGMGVELVNPPQNYINFVQSLHN